MKAILATGITALVLLVASCSQAPTTSKNLNEDAPASPTTKSKIGVDTWALRGSNTGVEVKGQTAAGKVMHELKVTVNADNTCSGVKNYRDAAGNIVASVQLKLNKMGKALSRTNTGNPSDPALCPECMGNDLKATDPSVIPDAASIQANLPPGRFISPCERAQRRFGQAFANVVNSCAVEFPDSDPSCIAARAAFETAFQDVMQDCIQIVPVTGSTGLGRSYLTALAQKYRAGQIPILYQVVG